MVFAGPRRGPRTHRRDRRLWNIAGRKNDHRQYSRSTPAEIAAIWIGGKDWRPLGGGPGGRPDPIEGIPSAARSVSADGSVIVALAYDRRQGHAGWLSWICLLIPFAPRVRLGRRNDENEPRRIHHCRPVAPHQRIRPTWGHCVRLYGLGWTNLRPGSGLARPTRKQPGRVPVDSFRNERRRLSGGGRNRRPLYDLRNDLDGGKRDGLHA